MDQHTLYNLFIEEWPEERVKKMTLQEYTNLNKSDSFCYWLEARTEDLGSIWGGSAFKFGIYEKNEKGKNYDSGGRFSDDDYAWYKKYGHTREEAFDNVKSNILKIIEFAQSENYKAIDKVDLGTAIKWKIAFLYSDLKIFNGFKKSRLFEIADYLGLPYSKKETYSSLQNKIMQNKVEDEDFFEFGRRVWEASETGKSRQYWLYSPGEEANKWEEFYKEGIMAIGWDQLGDLTEYENKEDIQKALQEHNDSKSSQKNNALCNYQFANEIKPGDIIILKKGRRQLLGYGEVKSDYYWEDHGQSFLHRRKVEWKAKGVWGVYHNMNIKTLTNITKYDSDIDKSRKYYEYLMNVMSTGSSQEISQSQNRLMEVLKYKKQIILQGPPGTGKTREAKIIARELIGINKDEKLNESPQFKLIQFHPSYTYEDFVRGITAKPNETGEGIVYEAENKVLAEFAERALENFERSQDSGESERAKDKFNAFVNDVIEEIDQNGQLNISDKIYIFSVEDNRFKYKGDGWTAHPNGLNMNFSQLKKIIDLGLNARQEINHCEELSSLARQHATYYQNVIQLYKKFTKGFKPKKENTGLKNYVLIIDEINRANLSSVLGELIYAMEYRGKAVDSMYAVDDSKELILPPNLYIIGTMNTADRSIGHIDYAIRRRFAFEEMLPKRLEDNDEIYFNTEGFDAIAKLFNANNVSPEFECKDVQIGHSYFIVKKKEVRDGFTKQQLFDMKMQYEVVPILLEYVNDGVLKGDVDGQSVKDYIIGLKNIVVD